MEDVDVCRICRGEETDEEPLFHPCKCSGSIQYVHQDCLLEWLDHATSIRGLKAECDLCKQPYQLRKRFKQNMPQTMRLTDYAIFWLKMTEKHAKIVFYAVRTVSIVLFLTTFADTATSLLITLQDVPIKLAVYKAVTGTCIVGNSVVSKAPYIDYLLNFVTKPSCMRTSIIHGFLLICALVFTVLFVWIVWMWLIEDEVVLHDVEHIMRGEMAHMDKGDEDALFDFISDVDHEEAQEPELNVQYVQPAVETIQELPASEKLPTSLVNEPVPGLVTELPLLVRLEGSKAFVYRISNLTEFDRNYPPEGLMLASDFLKKIPGTGFHNKLASLMTYVRLEAHNYNALLTTDEGKSALKSAKRQDDDTFMTLIQEMHLLELELNSTSPNREKLPIILDIAARHYQLRTVSNLAFQSSQDDEQNLHMTTPLPPLPGGRVNSSPYDPTKHGYHSQECIEKLGISHCVVYDLDETDNFNGAHDAHAHPLPEPDFSDKAKPMRAIINPPRDLYTDKEDFTDEMRAMLQENEEDGGDFELLLHQIAGFLGRPNWETLKALYFIVASLTLMGTLCGIINFLILNVFQLSNLAVYVLLTEKPIGLLSSPLIDSIASYFLAGANYTPESLKGRLMIVLSMAVVLNTSLRYAVLWNMNRLLKQPSGRRFVCVYYEYYVVLKTIIMTLIETLAFPIFCGAIIHIVVAPLCVPPSAASLATADWFSGARYTVGDAFEWHNLHYKTHLGTTMILQWICGYIYMHALQIMVAGCRKVMRRGVLFFLQDADTASFLKTMLQVSLPKQIYRISISGGIYGLLIFFGMGSAMLGLRVFEPSAWPLRLSRWPGFELLRLWWVVIVYGAFSTKFAMSSGQRSPRSYSYVLFTLWLRERVWLRILETSSRKFDLQSWLFGVPKVVDLRTKQALAVGDRSHGYFVRAPFEKKLKSRHKLQLFTPVDENDRRLDGKTGVMDREVKVYTVVWRPSHFRARLAGFMLFVWGWVALIVSLLTFLPLQLGRLLDYWLWDQKIGNDLVLLAAGMGIMLPVYGSLLYNLPPRELRRSLRFSTVVGRLPYPSLNQIGRKGDLVPAVIVSVLGFMVQNDQNPSAVYPWLLIDLRARQFGLVQAVLLALNIVGYVFLYHAAENWTESALNINYVFLGESLLILLGRGPQNIATKLGILLISAVIAYRFWLKSSWRQKLFRNVQEANYLEGIEVVNYPKDS